RDDGDEGHHGGVLVVDAVAVVDVGAEEIERLHPYEHVTEGTGPVGEGQQDDVRVPRLRRRDVRQVASRRVLRHQLEVVDVDVERVLCAGGDVGQIPLLHLVQPQLEHRVAQERRPVDQEEVAVRPGEVHREGGDAVEVDRL